MRKGCASGKRVQSFGGAKNHMIIMPDADLDQAIDALIGAGYGSAGERCMAISVAVPVGEKTAEALLERLIPRVEKLKIGLSSDREADYGPLVTKEALARVKSYVDLGIKEGARSPSMAVASACRAMRTDSSWAAACSTGSSPACASTRKKSSVRCCRWSGPRTTRKLSICR